MKFHFRLERMLHFQRLMETQKKLEVSASVQRLHFLERREAQLQENRRWLLAEAGVGKSDKWAFYSTQKLTADATEISKLAALIDEEKKFLENKKRELNEVVLRAKAFESLKETRRQEFRLEETRRQQKAGEEAYRITQQAPKR